MKDDIASTRRQFVRMGSATIAAIPLATLTTRSWAATNAALRSALKYQNTPNNGKACGACAQFVPGKDKTSPGGCKVIPGDTEISPQGWCTAFSDKPK
jgi:hypothetical protein